MSKVILCVANAYQQKYFLNEPFAGLPQGVKDELQVLSVMFTEDVGGILKLYFDEDGNLEFETEYEDGDFFYDEIGSVLKIKKYRNEKRELWEALEMYYRMAILGESAND